jgi:hypothetical protein
LSGSSLKKGGVKIYNKEGKIYFKRRNEITLIGDVHELKDLNNLFNRKKFQWNYLTLEMIE